MIIELGNGIDTIKGIKDVMIPSETNKYPDPRLARRLKKAGWRPDQIADRQARMREEESIETYIDVEIITPHNFGNKLKAYFYQEGADLSLLRAQIFAREAIKRVVGDGRQYHTRKVFDALTADQARVALIVGRGRETNGVWSLHDTDDGGEEIYVTSMSSLLSDLEIKKNQHAAIVAGVRNPTGYVRRATRDHHLFYVIGDPLAGLGKLNRQISDPVRR